MFATECSSPAATKAAIGGTMATILPCTRLGREGHPDREADQHVGEHARGEERRRRHRRLVARELDRGRGQEALARLVSARDDERAHDEERSREVAEIGETPGPPDIAPQPRWSCSQSVTISVLPVKSSAPAIITRISPSEKASPARSWRRPNGTCPVRYRHDDEREHRAERDEHAREKAEHQELEGRQRDLVVIGALRLGRGWPRGSRSADRLAPRRSRPTPDGDRVALATQVQPQSVVTGATA
jgi:hypothetical protein